jgi:hypothetical protein
VSLNWNLTEIADHKENCWRQVGTYEDGEPQYKLDPFLECLIWTCMQIDLGSLTDKTIDEFEVRMLMIQRAGFGLDVRYSDPDIPDAPLTREHLEKFKGLHTNVSKVGRKTWMRRLAKMIEDHALSHIRYRKEKETRESVEQEEAEECPPRLS